LVEGQLENVNEGRENAKDFRINYLLRLDNDQDTLLDHIVFDNDNNNHIQINQSSILNH